jgi:hypothetical protein
VGLLLSGLVVVVVIAILLPVPLDALWLALVIGLAIGVPAYRAHQRRRGRSTDPG